MIDDQNMCAIIMVLLVLSFCDISCELIVPWRIIMAEILWIAWDTTIGKAATRIETISQNNKYLLRYGREQPGAKWKRHKMRETQLPLFWLLCHYGKQWCVLVCVGPAGVTDFCSAIWLLFFVICCSVYPALSLSLLFPPLSWDLGLVQW